MGRPALPVEPKNCQQCGKAMERKRYNGRLEDRAMYRRRKFCGDKCATASFVVPVPSNTRIYCSRARRAGFLGDCCENCGTTERLQIHHVNGMRHNNLPENMQTLCIACHAAHHHAARRAGLLEPGRMVSGSWTPVGAVIQETPSDPVGKPASPASPHTSLTA